MHSRAAFLISLLLKSSLARLNVKKETVPGRHIGGPFCRLRLSPVRKSGRHERPNFQGRGLIFDWLFLMNRAFGDYVGLIFLSVSLNMDRLIYNPNIHPGTFWKYVNYSYFVCVDPASIAATSLILKSRSQGRGLRWYGFLWFLVARLPISNLFPLNAQGG